MNEETIIRVKLPATGKWYEFRVPLYVKIAEITNLIASILESRESGVYENNGEADLIVVDNGPAHGKTLNPKETFEDLLDADIIASGCSLMLV